LKKVACGKFFSFLVRRPVPKCGAFGWSSREDAERLCPSTPAKKIRLRKQADFLLITSSLFTFTLVYLAQTLGLSHFLFPKSKSSNSTNLEYQF